MEHFISDVTSIYHTKEFSCECELEDCNTAKL